jgi:hypothetical protein
VFYLRAILGACGVPDPASSSLVYADNSGDGPVDSFAAAVAVTPDGYLGITAGTTAGLTGEMAAWTSSSPDVGSGASGFEKQSLNVVEAVTGRAFLPLGDDEMLAFHGIAHNVYTDHVKAGTWEATSANVFPVSGAAALDPRDWSPCVAAGVPYALRYTMNGYDFAVYQGDTWSPVDATPLAGGPLPATGSGLFLAADGAVVHAFMITPTQTIAGLRWSAGTWALPMDITACTDANCAARAGVAGYSVVVGHRVGLIWSEGNQIWGALVCVQ